MTDETRLAFATVEERAKALSPFKDRISVRDYTTDVEIGAFQSERGVMQRLAFNVVVEVADQSDTDDNVDLILSYDTITEAIQTELAAERLNLLETLAERIGDRILAEPKAERVFVRIEKLDRGPFKLGVEIVRGAEHKAKVSTETVQPIIVVLGAAALSSANLSGWLGQLADKPVILCVEAPATAAVSNDSAQYRIDLLAIEQAAWRLSSAHPACVVVDNRTELDWGLKNGQLSVWAPSKIVVDIVEGAPQANVVSLANWLAEELNASELFLIGTEGSRSTQISARYVTVDETLLF